MDDVEVGLLTWAVKVCPIRTYRIIFSMACLPLFHLGGSRLYVFLKEGGAHTNIKRGIRMQNK